MDLWLFGSSKSVIYMGYEQAVILVGIMDIWLLGALRVLYRGYEQTVNDKVLYGCWMSTTTPCVLMSGVEVSAQSVFG